MRCGSWNPQCHQLLEVDTRRSSFEAFWLAGDGKDDFDAKPGLVSESLIWMIALILPVILKSWRTAYRGGSRDIV